MKLHVILSVVIALSCYVLGQNTNSTRNRSRYGITYGTKVTDFSKYSFFVKIWLRRDNSTFFCGGCIIDCNTILTAAHCVYGAKEFFICAGSGYTYETSNCFYHNDLTKVFITFGFHKAMQSGQFHDDLAIIKINVNLCRNVTTGVSIAPICSACYSPSCAFYEGTVGEAIGCGETEAEYLSNSLLKAGQLIIPQSEGVKQFPMVASSPLYNICFTKSSTSDQRISTCSGDSGSPLLLRNPDTGDYEVSGLVSFGTVNCTSGQASAFTYLCNKNYSNFIKWGYNSVSLASINDNKTLVQKSFSSYSIQMKPRSEAIWDIRNNLKGQSEHQENNVDVNEALEKDINDILEKGSQDKRRTESKFALFKLFLKTIIKFICFLTEE